MTTLLAGIHDREGANLVPAGGWCVDTVALSESPRATDYTALNPHIDWIGRLNWGYGRTGTIPHQPRDMVRSAREYVHASRGCHRWIIGNEPNHSQEWPDGQPISPAQYVAVYAAVRRAILEVQPHAQIIPAPVAPYNAESGDWLDYWLMCLTAIGRDNMGGLSLHSYIQRADPALVNSPATMDPPFGDRHFQFNAYQDLLNRVPAWARNLPVYLTEANPLDGWQARGIMPAMLENVQAWNRRADTQKIHAVVFYRYPDYDKWGMAGKPDVLAEFRAAAPRYAAPARLPIVEVLEESAVTDPAPVTPIWDDRLDQLGVVHRPQKPMPGITAYRLIEARWFDVEEAQGRHHVFVDVLDESGQRLAVPVHFWWGDGGPGNSDTKVVDPAKRDPWAVYGVDFPMSQAGLSYGVAVADNGKPSDVVLNLGLGTIAERDVKHHVAYRLVFQRSTPNTATVYVPVINPNAGLQPANYPAWVTAASGANVRSGPGSHYAIVDRLVHGRAVQVLGEVDGWAYLGPERWLSQTVIGQTPPSPSTVPALTHPVADPARRGVSQVFGARPDYYRQFTIDGVPLQGHEGVDFATPEGTSIVAADAGLVLEAADQGPIGYGRYVKLGHAWGETVYAHLSQIRVSVGQAVRAGQELGLSGNTGNSSGPHLHFGLRATPFDRQDGWGGYRDPLPFLSPASPETARPGAETVSVLRAAAREFGVAESLVLATAWEENKFHPTRSSPAGAMGLMQIMPATWAEWSVRVSAQDPLNIRDNARVGAAYLAWCLQQASNPRDGLLAYNWGIGNLRAVPRREPPSESVAYARRVLDKQAFLDAIEAK